MKKTLSVIMIIILCLGLASCSTATISGDLETYYAQDQSFSVELPSSDDTGWSINGDHSGSVLDLTDEADTVRIYIQCMSKGQAGAVASDLTSYRDYSIMNVFSDVLTASDMTDASVQTPDFITDSSAASYTYDGARGVVVFMESAECYYTYLIMAVEDAYEHNEDVLLESIRSLKELKETP